LQVTSLFSTCQVFFCDSQSLQLSEIYSSFLRKPSQTYQELFGILNFNPEKQVTLFKNQSQVFFCDSQSLQLQDLIGSAFQNFNFYTEQQCKTKFTRKSIDKNIFFFTSSSNSIFQIKGV